MQAMGKMLVLVGLAVVGLGVILMFFDRIPFLGKLPGDITIKRDNFQFHFPITTSILLSAVVSLLLWLFSHFKEK